VPANSLHRTDPRLHRLTEAFPVGRRAGGATRSRTGPESRNIGTRPGSHKPQLRRRARSSRAYRTKVKARGWAPDPQVAVLVHLEVVGPGVHLDGALPRQVAIRFTPVEQDLATERGGYVQRAAVAAEVDAVRIAEPLRHLPVPRTIVVDHIRLPQPEDALHGPAHPRTRAPKIGHVEAARPYRNEVVGTGQLGIPWYRLEMREPLLFVAEDLDGVLVLGAVIDDEEPALAVAPRP
jgi:hypothetical protein